MRKQILLFSKQEDNVAERVFYNSLTGRVSIVSHYVNAKRRKKHREDNVQIYKVKDSLYYKKNREKIKAQGKIYRAAHLEEVRKWNTFWRGEQQSVLEEIKLNMGCAICGYREYPEALDFHHVNPQDKKFQVRGNSLKRENFFGEMQKCICLCANCHRHITRIERKGVKA